MQETTGDPAVYVHTRRPQWGFAILTEEDGSKRRYLFQDGQTRLFQEKYFHMMQPADGPTEDVQLVSRRLWARLGAAIDERSLLAKGQMDAVPLDAQIEAFRALYPEGFQDPSFVADHRGGGTAKRLKRHLDGAIADAQSSLGKEELAALIAESNWTEVHARASSVIQGTSLCTPQLRKTVTEIPATRHADFAGALNDLLHGDTPSQERFSRFFGVLKDQSDVSWTVATLFTGLVFPHEHVVVEAWPFAKEARGMEPQLVVGSSPNAMVYERLREMSLRLFTELTAKDMAPRDLLDVRVFIAETLKQSRTKVARSSTKH